MSLDLRPPVDRSDEMNRIPHGNDRRRLRRLSFAGKVAVGAGILLVATTGAAYACVLPSPCQRAYAHSIGKILPGHIAESKHEKKNDDKGGSGTGAHDPGSKKDDKGGAPTTTVGGTGAHDPGSKKDDKGGAPTTTVRGTDPIVPKPGDTGVKTTMTLQCSGSAFSVSCSWTDKNPSSTTQVVLMRSTSDGNQVIMAATDLTVHSFQDKYIHAGTHYKYWLVAYGSSDNPLGVSNGSDVIAQ